MQNILKDKILNVYLKQNEHANLDSLPLRFGFYFSDNRVLELFNCENAKRLPDENSEKYPKLSRLGYWHKYRDYPLRYNFENRRNIHSVVMGSFNYHINYDKN